MLVMVVEDVWNFNEHVSDALREAGHEVLQAVSLSDAEGFFAEHGDSIQVVFWDNGLPDGEASKRPDLLSKAPAINISVDVFTREDGYYADAGDSLGSILRALKEFEEQQNS